MASNNISEYQMRSFKSIGKYQYHCFQRSIFTKAYKKAVLMRSFWLPCLDLRPALPDSLKTFRARLEILLTLYAYGTLQLIDYLWLICLHSAIYLYFMSCNVFMSLTLLMWSWQQDFFQHENLTEWIQYEFCNLLQYMYLRTVAKKDI